MINSIALLSLGEVMKRGGVSTRPVIGSVDAECAALVERLMRKTIDVSGFLKLLLNGGLETLRAFPRVE